MGLMDLYKPVSPDAAERLIAFRSAVQKRFAGHVDKVVLFGSRARGDARRYSDYDVAVFFTGSLGRREVDHALADLAYPHILAGFHIRPVAILKSPKDSNLGAALAINIAREGVVV